LRRGTSPEDAFLKLKHFGLPYAAWRIYLWNEATIDLPRELPPSLVGFGVEPEWHRAEEPIGLANFPLPEVPPERRTLVARTAARLYSLGKLSRGAFADALAVTPASDLERVLDFFALDPPSESG
jgi:hypothetical protein